MEMRFPNGAEPTEEYLEILRAARKVMLAKGVRSASTDDIAAAAGISRVTLYRKVGKKMAVLDATFMLQVIEVDAEIRAKLVPYDSLEWEPLDHLENWIVASVLRFRSDPLLERMLDPKAGLDSSQLLGGDGEDIELVSALCARVLRDTWAADVHGRRLDADEAAESSAALGAILGRFLYTLVMRPNGPPYLESEGDIRAFVHAYMAPLFLMRR